jgi:hypothetical protein
MGRKIVRKCIVVFSGVLFVVSTICAQERNVASLKSGTPLLFEITETVDSKTAKVGDLVKLKVLKEVKADGAVVIKAGAEADGKVAEVKEAKGWGRKGAIAMNISSTKAVDGTEVLLSATQKATGEGRGGTATAVGVVAGLIFFPLAFTGFVGVVAGLIFFPLAFTGFLIKGEQGKLLSGTEVKGYVDGEYKIRMPDEEKREGEIGEQKPSDSESLKGVE